MDGSLLYKLAKSYFNAFCSSFIFQYLKLLVSEILLVSLLCFILLPSRPLFSLLFQGLARGHLGTKPAAPVLLSSLT